MGNWIKSEDYEYYNLDLVDHVFIERHKNDRFSIGIGHNSWGSNYTIANFKTREECEEYLNKLLNIKEIK